jgi:hypothetical protein
VVIRISGPAAKAQNITSHFSEPTGRFAATVQTKDVCNTPGQITFVTQDQDRPPSPPVNSTCLQGGEPQPAEMRVPIDNVFLAWMARDAKLYVEQWATDAVRINLRNGERLTRAKLQADRERLFSRLASAEAHHNAKLRSFKDGVASFDVSYSLTTVLKTGRKTVEKSCERYRVAQRQGRWLIILNEDNVPCP